MARRACTVSTAIEDPIDFNTVSNDSTLTVRALRRHRLDRTFKTVEYASLSSSLYRERLVVFVSAYRAFSHFTAPLKSRIQVDCRRRVAAAFSAARRRPALPLVRTAFMAVACRSEAVRFAALLRAWLASAV